MSDLKANSPCLELAIEGERLCRAGELQDGISCFHSALSRGTTDLRCLSAIYCQLGNAYFCHQNYAKALEYHGLDLAVARSTGSIVNEAQASGNLGNALKMLGKYEESIKCFNRQLDLSRQLEDKQLEARALYNLGSVYHAKGKQWARQAGQSDPGEFPTEAAEAQRKALDFYTQNLSLVRELGDRPAVGRVYGNLGNTYYLLGQFHKAVECHQERLNFATEFGDLTAQRRAYSNLGNAHIYLADFPSAANNYRNALLLAQQLNAVELEAQACYSLGNTFTLIREPSKALIYYLRHLVIARRLGDRVGEGRAHWSLANTYITLERYDLALRCARRHRHIAQELHDDTGSMTAQLMIREIQGLITRSMSEGCAQNVSSSVADSNTVSGSAANCTRCGVSPWETKIVGSSASTRPPAMVDVADEDLNVSVDPELDTELERELSAKADEFLDTVELINVSEDGRIKTVTRLGCLDVPEKMSISVTDGKRDRMSTFYSSAPSFQRHSMQRASGSAPNSGDLEDQLESIGPDPGQPTHLELTRNSDTLSPSSVPSGLSVTDEEQAEDQQEFFFSLLLNSQARRMDEQRCCLSDNITSSTASQTLAAPNNTRSLSPTSAAVGTTVPYPSTSSSSVPLHLDQVSEEAFFDLIEGVQGDRMDDQRAHLPTFPGLRPGPDLSSCNNITPGTETTAVEVGSLCPATSSFARDAPARTSVGSSGASDGLPEPVLASAWSRALRSSGPTSRETKRMTASNSTTGTRDLDDEFLEMILRLQSATRINDQRSNLPDPLSRAQTWDDCRSPSVPTASHAPTVSHSQSQASRCSLSVAQISTSTSGLNHNTSGSSSATVVSNGDGMSTGSFNRPCAPTVPDEDFFALIQRVQSTRLDEQRCNPPPAVSSSHTSNSAFDSRQSNPTTNGMAQRGGSLLPSSASSATVPTSSVTIHKSSSQSSGSRRRVGSWRRLSSNTNRQSQ
ncbi:G-protein-signaling modulator 2 [Fasciola gigantica]|uniref:G-protein-signaling modulator 2 n=1 Tax=Fasciola gigantica TaxID=46835 RepID=A0A504YG84_FASGI|nr:G-protein-signaling modulator 2 [Fasciola gigantica]